MNFGDHLPCTCQMCLLLWAEAYTDLARDVASDLVLQGNNVAQVALVPLGPDVLVAGAVD